MRKIVKLVVSFSALLCLLAGCSTFKAQELDYKTVSVIGAKKNMHYGVYTPPNWQKSESLPLVIFLHGARDSHTSFEKFKAHEYFDRQINGGNMPRVVVLTPNGDNGFWENWYDGTHYYRDWVLNDVMPVVQRDYNTLACPQHCHLVGISMGGFGVLRFAYFAKERFSSVSAISAPILSAEESSQAKSSLLIRLLFPLKRIFGPNLSESYKSQSIEKVWLSDKRLQNIRLQLIVGDKDRKQIVKANQRFHKLLVDNNIEHEYTIYSGGHKWQYWIPNFNKVINFLVNNHTTSSQ